MNYDQVQSPSGSVRSNPAITDAFNDDSDFKAYASSLRSDAPASFPWGRPASTNRGCLMARPGTKGVLMLFSLIAEEEALMETLLQRPVKPEDFDKKPTHQSMKAPWRCFTAAGDDHAAIGLKSYLQKIGENHEKNRMVVSKTKHGISRTLAKFTEEWFIKIAKTVFTGVPKTYEEDPFVDTTKMRLVGPETKPPQGGGSINPAIGKGPMLFKRMAWAPKGFNTYYNSVGRARFFSRNRHYLPRVNGKYDRKVELPYELGGLSLSPNSWRTWDPGDVLKTTSAEHAFAIRHALTVPESTIRPILGRFASDRYARGAPLTEVEEANTQFTIPEAVPTYSQKEIRDFFLQEGKIHEYSGIRAVNNVAHKSGMMTEADLKEHIQRNAVQTYLLTKGAKPGFETASWEERYRVMDNCIRMERIQLGLQLSSDDHKIAEELLATFNSIEKFRQTFHKENRWYNLEETCISTPNGKMLDLREALSYMQLSLNLPAIAEVNDISVTSSSCYSLENLSSSREA